MRIILQIAIILLFFGCSNLNYIDKTPPSMDLVVNQDKYSLILKHYLNKNFKNNNKNLAKFIVKTNLSFNTTKALSISGNNSLNIIKGIIDYQVFNKSKTKLIKSGSISSSINTGSVSSLYGIDENNNFAKERISKYLASKLFRKILLIIEQSEN